MSMRVYSCLSLLSLLSLLCLSSFAYTINPVISSDKSPVPGDTVFFNLIKDNGDVDVVDVILVNTGAGGNLTTILSPFTTKTNSNQGFDIPKTASPGTYLIRFVDSSSKRFIIDSATFQINAPGANSVSSSKSTSPTSSPTPSTNTDSSPKKKSSIGPIVGGVVGGLVAVAVIVALLFCRLKRKRNSQSGDQDFGNEKMMPFSSSSASAKANAIEPFTIAPRPTLPDLPGTYDGHDGTSTTQVSSFTFGSGATGAVSNGKGGYLGDIYRPSVNAVDSSAASMLPSSEGSVIGSTTGAVRAEQLRRERERISREIAALESSSGTAGGSISLASNSGMSSLAPGDSASAVSGVRDREISTQLARLQEQIRQIEARQAFPGEATDDFSIPPPMYDGHNAPMPPPPAPAPPRVFPTPQTVDADEPAGHSVLFDDGRRALPNSITNTSHPDVKAPAS